MSTRSKCVINRRSRIVKASGPEAPSSTSRDSYRKHSSIRVVMSAVEGLSGVIARMNVLWRGVSQPGTHVGDCRPSVQRSSKSMSIFDMAALTDRIICCAQAALFTEAGKGRVSMRATPFRPSNIRAVNGGFMPRISSGIGGSFRDSLGVG